jgi:hypothetical protein
MMIGEIGFDDLHYPYKMVLQPSSNPLTPLSQKSINIRIPQFEEAVFNISTINSYENTSNEIMEIRVPQVTSYSNFSIPNLFNADINTSPKPPFYPGTAIIMVFLFILFVPVVALNLLVGLAVNDVQVTLLYV